MLRTKPRRNRKPDLLLALAAAVGVALASTVVVQVNAQGESPVSAPLETAVSTSPVG